MRLSDNTLFWQKTLDFCGYRLIGNTIAFGQAVETVFGAYFKRADDEWVLLFLGKKKEFSSEEECRSWVKKKIPQYGLKL